MFIKFSLSSLFFFPHASTCSPLLPCNTRREGRANVQALPSSRGDPWKTVTFKSCEGAKVSQGKEQMRTEVNTVSERTRLHAVLCELNTCRSPVGSRTATAFPRPSGGLPLDKLKLSDRCQLLFLDMSHFLARQKSHVL